MVYAPVKVYLVSATDIFQTTPWAVRLREVSGQHSACTLETARFVSLLKPHVHLNLWPNATFPTISFAQQTSRTAASKNTHGTSFLWCREDARASLNTDYLQNSPARKSNATSHVRAVLHWLFLIAALSFPNPNNVHPTCTVYCIAVNCTTSCAMLMQRAAPDPPEHSG